jgi:hypothetical protein
MRSLLTALLDVRSAREEERRGGRTLGAARDISPT